VDQSESELGGAALSDDKSSGSVERDDASLKQSGLEDGEPPAKMERLDLEAITQKRKHSTGKHASNAHFSIT
jgi:hypothetical protein